MKKITISVLVLSLLVTVSIAGFGALDDDAWHNVNITIPSIKVLTLTGTTDVSFSVPETTSPGDLPDALTADGPTLEYLAFGDSDSADGEYVIDAALDQTTSDAYDLLVKATGISAEYDGPNDDGDAGSAVTGDADSYVTLDTDNSNIIDGINAPVITGDSSPTLEYKLAFSDVPAPEDQKTYEVTYTITAAS